MVASHACGFSPTVVFPVVFFLCAFFSLFYSIITNFNWLYLVYCGSRRLLALVCQAPASAHTNATLRDKKHPPPSPATTYVATNRERTTCEPTAHAQNLTALSHVIDSGTEQPPAGPPTGPRARFLTIPTYKNARLDSVFLARARDSVSNRFV